MSIDYVMEAASGPHFSGLRLDGLLSSPPSSSTSSPAHRFSAPCDYSSSLLAPDSIPNQPFVIGHFLFIFILTSILGFRFPLRYGFCVNGEFLNICAGVSGGTASGKTTVCDMIIQQLHDHRVVLVNQAFSLSALKGYYIYIFYK